MTTHCSILRCSLLQGSEFVTATDGCTVHILYGPIPRTPHPLTHSLHVAEPIKRAIPMVENAQTSSLTQLTSPHPYSPHIMRFAIILVLATSLFIGAQTAPVPVIGELSYVQSPNIFSFSNLIACGGFGNNCRTVVVTPRCGSLGSPCKAKDLDVVPVDTSSVQDLDVNPAVTSSAVTSTSASSVIPSVRPLKRMSHLLCIFDASLTRFAAVINCATFGGWC